LGAVSNSICTHSREIAFSMPAMAFFTSCIRPMITKAFLTLCMGISFGISGGASSPGR
jgi:hypothetical protein